MEKYNFSKTIIKHHLSKKQRIFCFVAVVCMLFTGGFNLKAQDTTSEITVTGIVSDGASKNPVIGARVAIAETALSALTDENGSYTIKVATGSEVLVVTAEDYTSREIPVQGRKTINVDLYSEGFSSQYETFELMQGMKQRKAIIADPVSIISSGNFERSTSFSIDSDIQSRLGADARIINRSGVPGVGAAAFIRGLNSINANSQPLFIIDGVFWDNQMSSTSIHEGFFLNPLSSIDLKDIKSVTIVKDGNSLYGSKGSNGVILIETKRGKDMATRITADISFGLNQKPSFPKMMNASQYETYASNQIGGWFAANPRYVNSLESRERFFPFLIADPNAPEYWDYRNDTKWVDEVYQNGSSQSIGLSVSGGDNIALYHLSMGYTKNEGTLKETSVEKFNARFNSDIKMFSNILTKVDLFISQMSRDLRDDGTFNKTAPGFISLIKSPMLASHRLISGTQTPSPKLSDYDKMDPTDRNSLSNPVAIVEDAFGTSSRTGFNLKINPTLSITDNLSLGTTFAYTMSRVKESFFIPKTGIAPLIVNDVPSPVNEVRDMVQRQNSVFSDTRLNWKAKSGKNHGLNLFGGFRFTSDTYESMAPKGFNTGNDNVKILISAIQNKSVSGEDIKWKTISTYANVGYDYQKKYFLNLTASADASSRFGSNTKDGIKAFDVSWAIFPSASVAWLVSSEKFMKAIPEVNLLQLRASYGVTGNDDIDGYAARSYFESTELGGGNFGLVLLNIRNEKIQWETTKKRNVGLDVHLFDERVAFTADFFQSTTDNLLALKSLKSITGFKNYW
ncbi:MAG: SusC/RagA family TonB-linked outer membrane protein, partial [Dysgonamonadaceae bacterium]|nr:SusC/RagA family TonB-linked outer membrane protein [Dysgonamonadaceae bacterium]